MTLPEASIISNRAVLIVLGCNILLHVIDVSSTESLLQGHRENNIAYVSAVEGLTLFTYPLLGWLADVYLTRYTALKCAPIFSAVGATTTAIGLCIEVELWIPHHHHFFLSALIDGGIILMIVGSGLFEANALQFGLDQLMDSPSDHLSAFIHWYYWGIHFIQTLVVLSHIAITTFQRQSVCLALNNTNFGLQLDELNSYTEILALILALFLFSCFTFLILKWNKSDLTIQPPGINPFKKLYQVLKYTRKHKIPERRSAFTYWEEDVPARIDIGKEKYGGPFSNEEVEDTKTFLMLSLVILSLFGFQMTDDGFAVVNYLTRLGFCPSISLFLVLGLNAKFLIQVTIVFGVPLYRLILLPVFKHCIPRMMRKIWLGSMLSLFQISIYLLFSLIVSNDSLKCDRNSLMNCFCDQLIESVCIPSSNFTSDDVFIWMVVPQVLGGLSYMLVYMTVLEFLCAQSPRTMQGMLIGLWYSTGVIKYIGVEFTDSVSLFWNPTIVPILNVLKVCASLTSLLMYSCVSRRYRYRERDEAVNFQAMIEDQYEREIDQELLHEEQERLLFESSSVQRPKYGADGTLSS